MKKALESFLEGLCIEVTQEEIKICTCALLKYVLQCNELKTHKIYSEWGKNKRQIKSKVYTDEYCTGSLAK